MIASTTGARRRHVLLLAGTALIAVQSGCDEEGPIDREALERAASPPGSTVPMPTAEEWVAMQVDDVFTVPLSVHCGVRYLVLYDGPAWEATKVDSDFSDGDLEYVGTVWGALEMAAPDRLEFRHPKLTATFHPYEGDAEIGSCD